MCMVHGGAVGISWTMLIIWFLIALLWEAFVGIILASLGMGPGRGPWMYIYMVQNPAEVAAFVYECKKACLAMSSLSDLG